MKSIRFTTLIITIAVFFFLVVVSYLIFGQILKNSFEKLESLNAQINISRAKNALEAEIDSLYSLNMDWAVWDESYRFMEEINNEFIQENLVSNFFEDQNMAFILFLNTSGSLHWGRGYDFYKKEIQPIGSDFSSFFPKHIFLQNTNLEIGLRGLITIAGKLYIITSHQIFKTNRTGKSNGMLIMGKELDSAMMEKISSRTSLSLDLLVNESSDLPSWAVKIFADKEKISGVIYSSEETIISYTKLYDLKNSYSLLLTAGLERRIYQLGKETIKLFFLTISIIGLFFSIINFFLLETKVVGRIKKLGDQVKRLYQKEPEERVIEIDGSDELSFLALEINKMVKLLDLKSNSLESMAGKLKSMNNHLYELANTDSLTGLPNRKNIFENLASYIEIAKRYNKNFCLCIFDIDDFKFINDHHGYNYGDIVLKDISKSALMSMRSADKIARIGGEEFLILLSDTDITGAVSLCERLRLALSARIIKIDNETIKYTCSFGVTGYIKGKDSIDSIFMRADKYLNRAKAKGKNIVVSDFNFSIKK